MAKRQLCHMFQLLHKSLAVTCVKGFDCSVIGISQTLFLSLQTWFGQGTSLLCSSQFVDIYAQNAD